MAQGYVYFVYAFRVRRVKIGFSANHPEGRIRAIQTGCPVKLRRLGFVRGDMADEYDLHCRFTYEQRTGEWFDCSDDLRGFMRTHLEPWWPKPRVVSPDEAAVVAKFPGATANGVVGFFTVREAPRPGHGIGGRILGDGSTEAEAWSDAAASIRAGIILWTVRNNCGPVPFAIIS